MIGQLFAERYDVLSMLGQGGWADVYRAFDRTLAREVALKVYRPPALFSHAMHEARIAVHIQSQHALAVYDAAIWKDIPYLAGAIAEAGTSADRLADTGYLGLPARRVVRWIRNGLVGLDACHSLGLVHRDIKDSNLFLDHDDWALLGDFGIARAVDFDGHAPAGGTPAIKAPEMITTGLGDPRSDIYSMGVLAYRLLVGRWPFAGPDDAAVERAAIERRYVPLRRAAPHIPNRLALRIERAMKLDPDERYRSAMDFHHHLAATDLVLRHWERVHAHAGHSECWLEATASRGQRHRVCVIGSGPFEIESTFAVSGRRIREHSAIGIAEAKLGTRLQQIFDRL
jgi:serine/threonine-protein kinase